MKPDPISTMKIPVLTQVLDFEDAGGEPPLLPMLGEALAPGTFVRVDEPIKTDALDDAALAASVLESLHGQIDSIIRQKVQVALEPIWRRLTDDLASEVRAALTLTLSDTLRDAVKDGRARFQTARAQGERPS